MLKVVAFDLFGTLLDIRALVPLLEKHTPMAEAMFDAWRTRQLQLANAATASGRYMDFDRITLVALHEVAPRFHARLQPHEQKALVDAWAALPAFADASAAFEIVKRHRFRAVVVTNGVASTARNALEHAGLAACVEHVFSADAVKAYKPSKKVYEQLDGLKVAPSQVLFVSSHDWDALGARQSGLNSVWVNRRTAAAKPKAERSIESFLELDDVLRSIA